ncbi:hypothetical protein [Halostella salina]|uniref:hypothetical protein n=1 Tax=Halostella salina TaxID=1547897 RepID=UPI000EF84937|nr:hypothetical protein [Halostella salina]
MATTGSDDAGFGFPAVLGALAFLAGYAVTYLAARSTVESAITEEGFLTLSRRGTSTELVASDFQGLSPPGTRTVVGWAFFDRHGAALDGELTMSGGSGSQTFDLSLAVSADAWLMAVPPLLLVAAGYLVVRRGGSRSAAEAATAGATIAVGYAVVAALAALGFQWGQSGLGTGEFVEYSVRFGPTLSPSLLVAAVGYPVVFGAVGGYAARTLSGRSGDRQRPGPRPPGSEDRSGGRRTAARNRAGRGPNAGRTGRSEEQGRRDGQRERRPDRNDRRDRNAGGDCDGR